MFWFFQFGGKEELFKDTSSISELLEESESNKTDLINKTNQVIEGDDNKNEDVPAAEEVDDDSDKENDIAVADSKKPSEISVQVLNGGAKSGVAGTLTTTLKTKGYKTKAASNANNNVEDIVIYYAKDLKKEAEELAKLVSDTYGETSLEEVVAVTDKYGADIVVVTGKQNLK